MATVTLAHLRTMVEFLGDDDQLLDNAARHVVFARSFDALAAAGRGDVVVLDEPLRDRVGTYHFDLALGRAGQGVSAIVLPSDCDTTITGRRLATTRGIALAQFLPTHDVATISAWVEQARAGAGGDADPLLVIGCALIDGIEEPDDVEPVLATLSDAVGVTVALVTERRHDDDLAIRIHGVDREYVHRQGADDQPGLRPLWSHLARTLEDVHLRHDAGAHAGESARAALLNELLLGDGGTSADSASRLRRAGYPVDGSHGAIWIDCHDLVPDRRHAEFSLRQRLMTLVAAELRIREGASWSRAGTDTSIIVLASHPEAGVDLDRDLRMTAEELLAAMVERIEGVRVHVGIGGVHVGVEGVSQTVAEATTAARMASARSKPNEIHHIDRLGFSRALVHWAEIDGVRPVLAEILEPLEELGPAKADRAIETLRVYLDSGRNLNMTARMLGLHRNTARYRVERISNSLEVDLEDPEQRLLVELACRVRESLRAMV
ncbi:MAG: helix-turn-helix domain-containing protein [Actinomycetota bacterium]